MRLPKRPTQPQREPDRAARPEARGAAADAQDATPPRSRAPDDQPPAVDRFLAELARTLHESGTPSHRLEALVSACASRLGHRASVFALPTWISLSVDSGGAQRSTSFRVEPGAPKLALLEEVFRVADRVTRGDLDAPGGLAELARIRQRLWRPPSTASFAGYALFSAAAARLLGGGVGDMVAAAVPGIAVGLALWLAAGRRERELLSEFGGALVATLVASLSALGVTKLGLQASTETVALAGFVVLLPGLSLTTAMAELSARNLAAGSARLMGAVTSLVVIAMGVAAGKAVAGAVGLGGSWEAAGSEDRVHGPDLLLLLAIVLGSLGIAIAFHAHPRRLWLVLAASFIGYGAAWLSRQFLDGVLAAVCAAALIGVVGNLYSLVRRRPTGTIILPAVALLLPGSIGFRGMQGLISRDPGDTISGIDTFMQALVIAASIAAGLLVANALVPRRVSV